MRYIAKETGVCETIALQESLKPVLNGLGLKLIEFIVSRHKGSVQIRAVVYNGGAIGLNDCSRAHHAIMPRLELAFQGQDVYLEVSSPGINRLIKDGAEFVHYLGRGIRCYRTDISDWSAGILENVDEKGIFIKRDDGKVRLEYEIIAKAKLDPSQEVKIGN